MVEEWDRSAWFVAEYVEAALVMRDNELPVVALSDGGDGLTPDSGEIMATPCRRSYQHGAAASRAADVVAAAMESP